MKKITILICPKFWNVIWWNADFHWCWSVCDPIWEFWSWLQDWPCYNGVMDTNKHPFYYGVKEIEVLGELTLLKVTIFFFSVCLLRKWMKISCLCGSLVVYVYMPLISETAKILPSKILGKLKTNKYNTRIKTSNISFVIEELISNILLFTGYWNKCVLVVNLVVSIECGNLCSFMSESYWQSIVITLVINK